MFSIKKKFYVFSLLILVFLILLISSFIFYYQIETYDSNRIYNLRNVDKKYRAILLENYIDRVYKENSILILGDSQPNGHNFPDKFIFSTLLQDELNTNIINLAFQDSRILDNIFILNYCKEKNYKFKAIIFNINHSHIKESEFQHLDLKNKINWKISIYSNLKSFYRLAFNPNPDSIPKESITFAKYPDYFGMNNLTINSYIHKIETIIKLSKSISINTIFYLTPHSINAIKYNKQDDLEKIKLFNKNIINYCQINSIDCFEPDIFEDKYFIDIVHFNSLGHRKMADLLKIKFKNLK